MKSYNLKSILQNTFELEDFRENQKEIIEHIIDWNHALVFMPTGWGKSLTYQLPWYIRDGLCIVISPLISLMKDQVDKLQNLGISAQLLNSTQDRYEQEQVLHELRSNTLKFLYIAPERLHSWDFRYALQSVKISLLAIDEAHCISQWGHDFRPSYMKIKWFIEELKNIHNTETSIISWDENNWNMPSSFPIVALTATATVKVRIDIKDRLGLVDPRIFISGFDRKNICIVVREISAKEEKQRKVLEVIKKTNWVGIIYCSSRKHVIELSEFLSEQWIQAGIYKWDLSSSNRDHQQNAFMNDEYKVIVATNAFGMWIDKKDIRFIIHYNLPGSIESYYQEIGRAWRDGKMSYAITLASYGDTKIQEFFIENTYPSKREVLMFYNYLYKDMKLWAGTGTKIAKTQYVMASESGIGNEMRVGSIIKILEKYNILERGIEWWVASDFKGRGLTLKQGKKRESDIPIDWKKQSHLEDEAYYKLAEMKKLLFYPQCRKRYILQYFWDEEDLQKLPDNCWLCDFCLEAKKYSDEDLASFLPLSSYEVILESIKRYHERFGQAIFIKMLLGSSDQKVLDWNLIYYEHYWALKNIERNIVSAMFDALIEYAFLEKTHGRYPLMSITAKWQYALRHEWCIKKELSQLNSFVMHKVPKRSISSTHKKQSLSSQSKNTENTYSISLELFNWGKSISEISQQRNLKTQTIEGHIIALYEQQKISLLQILWLVDFKNISLISQILTPEMQWLKDIKNILESQGYNHISYFEIKVTLAMREKKDI